MKFQIDRDLFQEALNQVQSVVSNRTTLPILSNVFIEADELGLSLSTTDLEVYIKLRVPAKVIEPGKTTLPAKRLTNIIRELPTSEINFNVNENDVSIVESKSCTFKILGLASSEFPNMGEFDDAKEFVLEQSLVKDSIKKTYYAISTDETRYVLNGINCLIGNKTFTLVATDGRRLAMVDKEVSLNTDDEVNTIIIPTKAINELQKILTEDGEVTIRIKENKVSFELNNAKLITNLIDGKYPNFQQVIPKSFNFRIIIERELLLNAVKRVSLVTNEKTNSIKFTFDENLLEVSSNSPEVGEAKEILDIRYEGEKVVTAFNPEFVMAPLRNINNDEIFFDLIDDNSPGVIKIDEPFLYVLMPMRIAG